ncbi:hypothetical protein [Bradyrhizobium nanningense]|uniref:hypothetical protein n=1 Tax=Bradyrhizobium nanningense TaxID=1325118 RepID=UPI0010088BB6|nr:hypothetical protein [Bradyrhizobium nanningense]
MLAFTDQPRVVFWTVPDERSRVASFGMTFNIATALSQTGASKSLRGWLLSSTVPQTFQSGSANSTSRMRIERASLAHCRLDDVFGPGRGLS